MPGYNVCGERAVKNIRLIKASSAAFVSAVESFSQLRKKTISAYTCTSARPIFNVATITQRAHKPNFFFTFYFFFVFSFLFRRICHAKCFELQPQNVLFSAAVDPTVSICSNYCEQRREESLQLCAVGSEKVLQNFNTQKLLQNICIWTRE